MVYLSMKNIVKEFPHKGGKLKVLDGINFDIRKGEFITIFGPNGCGKTTLLKILLGSEDITLGSIKIKKDSINNIKSYLIFQNPNESLFNWMDTKENIKLAIKSTDNNKINNLLKKIQVGGKTLFDFRKYYPYQLSGGLKQLTVIARAIIYNPQLLLLDEPFSSLDYKTATELEDTILNIWEKTKQTIIFVSHNIEEAVYLADKIIVLSNPPTKVSKIIEVNLPRPRRQEIKFSSDFQKIKKQVLENFGKKSEH